MVSLEGVEYHQKAEEDAETREEMIRSLRYQNEREKLCEFSPPLVRLWAQILGKWPAPTSGGWRYLLEAREWFLVQMTVLAEADIRGPREGSWRPLGERRRSMPGLDWNLRSWRSKLGWNQWRVSEVGRGRRI